MKITPEAPHSHRNQTLICARVVLKTRMKIWPNLMDFQLGMHWVSVLSRTLQILVRPHRFNHSVLQLMFLPTATEISDEDLSTLCAFALKVKSFMPTRTYSMLAHTFPKEPPPSLARAHAHATALSGVEPTLFDCCVNSCCCYVGPYIDDQHCHFCNEPRFDSRGRPCSQFTYVPLLP